MSRRVALAAIVAAAIGMGSVVVCETSEREPVYQGEQLSYWLKRNDHLSEAEARRAVLNIGTNALPTLLRMLQARDSAFKRKFMDLAAKQDYVSIEFNTAYEQWNEAVVGFGMLGENATGAVPALVELYNKRASPDLHEQVARALGAMGPSARAAVPALIQDLVDTNEMVRANAAEALLMIR